MGTWSHMPSDAPQYRIASGLDVASLSTIFVTLLLLGFWMERDNCKRDRRQSRADESLSVLSKSEMQHLEYKHTSFRWAT